jgi:hypothetical protein
VVQRDWRSYLWLDFDLTGLPCGPLAEASQRLLWDKKCPVSRVSAVAEGKVRNCSATKT